MGLGAAGLKVSRTPAAPPVAVKRKNFVGPAVVLPLTVLYERGWKRSHAYPL
jgi:hypothetical protein